jgi:hypothetical protein
VTNHPHLVSVSGTDERGIQFIRRMFVNPVIHAEDPIGNVIDKTYIVGYQQNGVGFI